MYVRRVCTYMCVCVCEIHNTYVREDRIVPRPVRLDDMKLKPGHGKQILTTFNSVKQNNIHLEKKNEWMKKEEQATNKKI